MCGASATARRFADDPFQLGVASGDPTPTGGVLWTRLAPRPLEPDGGMAGVRQIVNWQLAADDKFSQITKQGTAVAAPELGHSVHVDLDGLAPDRWYYYRFTAGDATSEIGRFRTAPDANATTPLHFAFVSCQHYEQGLYTSYAHLARENLDLVSHLGDYIYESNADARRRRASMRPPSRSISPAIGCATAQYKIGLAAARAPIALCPWLVIWDDHEVDNNYAGLFSENAMESEEQMRTRRAAAYQAWWEHQPVRVPRARSWADLDDHAHVRLGIARAHLSPRRTAVPQRPGVRRRQREVPCGDWADPEAHDAWRRAGAMAVRWSLAARARGGRCSRIR